MRYTLPAEFHKVPSTLCVHAVHLTCRVPQSPEHILCSCGTPYLQSSTRPPGLLLAERSHVLTEYSLYSRCVLYLQEFHKVFGVLLAEGVNEVFAEDVLHQRLELPVYDGAAPRAPRGPKQLPDPPVLADFMCHHVDCSSWIIIINIIIISNSSVVVIVITMVIVIVFAVQ